LPGIGIRIKIDTPKSFIKILDKMYAVTAKLDLRSRKGTQMNNELTPAQIKSKREDEIACRVAFALAGIIFIGIAISHWVA
jgi:hypothetical protein